MHDIPRGNAELGPLQDNGGATLTHMPAAGSDARGIQTTAVKTGDRYILNGEKLWVVGFGDNYPLVHFARAQLIKVRPDIRIIPLSGFSVPEEFASISSADVMLACGVGRRPRACRNITGSAKRAGARVILLTDAARANDAASVDVVLRCRSIGVAMFDSMTAAVSLLTFLLLRGFIKNERSFSFGVRFIACPRSATSTAPSRIPVTTRANLFDAPRI